MPLLPPQILQIPIVLCYYQLAVQDTAHAVAASKLHIWWLANHQVEIAGVLGQFLGLFLREDCDLGASVLTLGGKKTKKTPPKTKHQKTPKTKQKTHQLLFLRCSSSGMFQPSGCMGEELLGENSLIGLLIRDWFLQVLKIMFRYLKNPAVNEAGMIDVPQ